MSHHPHRLRNDPFISHVVPKKELFLHPPWGMPHFPTSGNTSFKVSANIWEVQSMALSGSLSAHSIGFPPLLCISETLRLQAQSLCCPSAPQHKTDPWQNSGKIYLTWFEAKLQRYACKCWKQKGYRKPRIQSCLQYFLLAKDIHPKHCPWTADC